MLKTIIYCILFSFITACSVSKPHPVNYHFESANGEPDYSNLNYWAAHPEKYDPSDSMPKKLKKSYKPDTTADVFFLYPTSFLDKDFQSGWNARIDDEIINRKTDQTAVLYQASIFNSAGRVFAPRYRQANYYCYFTHDTAAALAAFDLAYTDIKAAFQYYLDHYNNGRPIIIASHSQGTTHAKRLMREFFDGKPLQNNWSLLTSPGCPCNRIGLAIFPPVPALAKQAVFVAGALLKKGILTALFKKNNILRWSPTRLPGTAASLMQTVSPIEAPCYTS